VWGICEKAAARVFYVAATRATQRLVIGMSAHQTTPSTFSKIFASISTFN
jgi:ATP-dependent exoDNAse (exonuclease V) beta subunit